jgi:tRNA U34 5-methylaminomethyl-2-thiouridine-forming methyltransferase MnmC
LHVFIKNGLMAVSPRPLHILEIGFGTGLNALLACHHAICEQQKISYHGIEPFPISEKTVQKLNYPHLIGNTELINVFEKMHSCKWNSKLQLNNNFEFCKFLSSALEFEFTTTYDLVFFDAFSPEKQGELWTVGLFTKIFNALNPGALLVTYCAKGDVKRALRAAGFNVKRLSGPPGKRHMLQAWKV